uniref:Thionin-like protein 2 n=1 Tax=Cucumis melo TaxID=3656 RepID=A0A9I9EC00_CUCME
MRSVVICLIILSLFVRGSTAMLKDSPMDTNQYCKVGCIVSRCNLNTIIEIENVTKVESCAKECAQVCLKY